METAKTFGSNLGVNLSRVSTSSGGDGEASALTQAGGQDNRAVGVQLAKG